MLELLEFASASPSTLASVDAFLVNTKVYAFTEGFKAANGNEGNQIKGFYSSV